MVSSSLLGNRKVIAFATHGLLAGDIDGLDEPALALSSPAVTGVDEDGLLKMSEIMQLQLDADWVVLSACNTGAADGKGVEAASGLGRAFFYAGSKTLLLTVWPVESTSAMLLTTAIFKFQQEEPSLSRSGGVQKAILDLIENGYMEDPRTGQKVAGYAHPLFWAPFIVVGDGGK
jgi:CHAT domain-containing protein